MDGRILFLCFGAILTLNVGGVRAQGMLGAAEVLVTNVESCPDAEQYRWSLGLVRRRVSRTMEAYNSNVTFDVPLDGNVGIYINLAKLVDGGYKPNAYEMSDDNFCEFFMTIAKELFSEFLRLAGVEPRCPVPPGEYSVSDFILDYDGLPATLLYGDFRIDIYATSGGERIMCQRVYASSKPKESSFSVG